MKKKVTYMVLGMIVLMVVLTTSGCASYSKGTSGIDARSSCLDKEEDVLSELM